MLSDDRPWDLWNAQGTDDMSKAEAFTFAHTVETEVRKQDTKLIQQMLDALEGVVIAHKYEGGTPIEAITAARKRLENT